MRRAHCRPVDRLEPRRLLAGHTYYLSPTGSDTADGLTPATAWRTLAAANAVALGPGDGVRLQGGATFAGTLTIGPADAGTAAAPVTVSSFGTGRATISSGLADGIDVTDTSGVAISNLDVVGGGSAVALTAIGISLFDDLPATAARLANGITIDSVDVTGFGDVGVGIGSATVTTGFDHVTVSNATLHDDGTAGLFSYAGDYTADPAPYGLAHADVTVDHVTAYANAGHAGRNDSGSGICLGSVDGATIEHCVADGNGAGNTSTGGGPVGIWTYDSTAVVIRSCESYANTAAHSDGDGFDLDGGTTDSTIEDCYSHDNAGAGVLLCQFAGASAWGGNTVRYNVSQDDGGALNYAPIFLWAASNTNTLDGCDIYGNTVYNSRTGPDAPKGIEIDVATTNVHVRNNLFDVTAGGQTVLVKAAGTGLLFQGNDYWAGTAAAAGISWVGRGYATVAAWRTGTGQETVGTVASGGSLDPQLAEPGGGVTVGPSGDLTTLSAYRLARTSPLINAGVNLSALGVTPAATDFFGQPTPDGAAFDVGADEVDVTPPTATLGPVTLGPVTLGATTATFGVTFADNVAVSVGTAAVVVTGPNGYSQTVTPTSIATAGAVVATYTVPAVAGIYSVGLPAAEVTDPTGNTLSGTIGTFAGPAAAAGPLTLAATGGAALATSADGLSLLVWATADTTTTPQSVPLASVTGVTVPAGTALALSAVPVPVTFAAGSAVSTVTATGGAAVVAAGARVTFDGKLTSLSVATNGRATVGGTHAVLTVGTLSVAAGGTMDIATNDLIVLDGHLPAASGYAGGAWTGAGLTSSAAAADASHLTGVGTWSGSALNVDGVAVPATAAVAKYTYVGDTNLDGTVDLADYTRADAGLIAGGTTWADGDFNGDGVVDGSDLTLIDSAFAGQGPSLAFAG